LFEFENLFDLNFNFGIKFKTAKKIPKTFSSYSPQPIFHFGPGSLAPSPVPLISFVFIFMPAHLSFQC
jgi:hypothetical protein